MEKGWKGLHSLLLLLLLLLWVCILFKIYLKYTEIFSAAKLHLLGLFNGLNVPLTWALFSQSNQGPAWEISTGSSSFYLYQKHARLMLPMVPILQNTFSLFFLCK